MAQIDWAHLVARAAIVQGRMDLVAALRSVGCFVIVRTRPATVVEQLAAVAAAAAAAAEPVAGS